MNSKCTRPAVRSRRAGWTLIETLLAITLIAAVLGKAAFVTHAALHLANEQSASMHYEDQARQVMDRIALAIMGSDRDTLVPQVQEVHSNNVRYTFSLGMEDGEIVWSDTEEIRLDGANQAVVWRENPDLAEERRVIWTSRVSPLLEGEVINGLDDNGNGLIDEDGLSFVLEGNRIHIRLSLRRPESDGRTVTQTIDSIVCLRN